MVPVGAKNIEQQCPVVVNFARESVCPWFRVNARGILPYVSMICGVSAIAEEQKSYKTAKSSLNIFIASLLSNES